MYDRLLKPPTNSFFLFGPRGTGKSHWVKRNFKHSILIDLLDSSIYNDLLAKPKRLEEMIPQDHNDWVIIDEIQRVPMLLNHVHRMIENRKIRFGLTGSSARKLRKKGTNLLAGRARTRSMHPLTHFELRSDFDLDYALKFGLLPTVWLSDDPSEYLESYLKTYLREEIQEEGLTRNLPAFARFLESASFSQGSILNINNVAEDCQIERRTVSNYFLILNDLLIADELPVFSKKAKRKLMSRHKFYFFDCGVFRTIRPKGPLDQPGEIQGLAFETLIFQILRALQSVSHKKWDLFYWRTATHEEVDFVLYGEMGIFAIEVKHSSRVRSGELNSLSLFQKDYPKAKCIFIYRGERNETRNGIQIMTFNKAIAYLDKLFLKDQ
jgi:uncharacterized protein